MKTWRVARFAAVPSWALGGLVLLTAIVAANAQVAPATPTKFETRRVGDATTNGGATIGVTAPQPPPPPVVKQVTYFALCDARQWTSNDGKPLLGKMIAFEDVTVTMGGPATPIPPSPPAKPTIIQAGKVRLLVDNRAYEVPLERLCEADRKFVATVQAGFAGPAASGGTGKAAAP